jgi:hypothetical protein
MAQKTNDRTTRNHVLRKGKQFLLHVTLITNQVTSHEWGKDWFVITEHKKNSLQTEILKIGKFINYLIKFHILNNGSISSHGKNLIFFYLYCSSNKIEKNNNSVHMFVIDSLNEYCDYNKSYLFMLSTVDLFHAALTPISRYVYSL